MRVGDLRCRQNENNLFFYHSDVPTVLVACSANTGKDRNECQREKSTSGFRYTMRMKSSPMLKQSHTKTSPLSENCKRTAPKLLYVAKGLKYGWYYHDDVM